MGSNGWSELAVIAFHVWRRCVDTPLRHYNVCMKANMGLSSEDLAGLTMVYGKDSLPEAPLTAASLAGGSLPVRTASLRPAIISLRPVTGESVSARDELYLKTDVAAATLDSSQSVLAFVEKTIQVLPGSGQQKGAFARTPLDDNLCRLKGLFADLQRPAVSNAVGAYEDFKETAAKTVDFLSADCRRHVTETAGTASSMQTGLSPAELETVQNFNHLRQVMTTVFKLPLEDGEIYLDAQVQPSASLDDAERGGMNRVFSTISYSGTNRPFYMRYMPYYLLSMRAPLFIHALSRPRQLSATTTRPGPLKLPDKIAVRYGVPNGVQMTYHSVSRYGLSNQTDREVGGPPMRFYYSYSDNGVTKVLSFDKKEHFYVQLVNRPPLQLPPGMAGNTEPLTATYVMYERARQAYVYQTASKRLSLTQQQHQNILLFNADSVNLDDPNSPVHFSYASDGSLDSVMNRIFNDNAVRVVSSKSSIVELIPKGYKDKMQLMGELAEIIKPAFQREQDRIEAIRMEMFRNFAQGKVDKAVIEDTCRKEAVASFRKLVSERRMQVPVQAGRQLIGQAVATINDLFDEMYAEKSDDFARVAAARHFYASRTEPFFSAFKDSMAKSNGFLNLGRAMEDITAEDRRTFDALVLRVAEQMEAPGAFRDQLKAAYWGGVTQYLVDLNYGPEGIVREGDYVGRDALPRIGREFEAHLEKKAPELLADPVQVANRLRSTFAYFQYNVSPYYSLPWPNLYRNNDLLRSSGQPNAVRDQKTIKPRENPVEITMTLDNRPVRMMGSKPREVSRHRTSVPTVGNRQRSVPEPSMA
jgi:hypothetical protein